MKYLKERIQILDSVSDWQEAINIASKPLLDDNSIKKSYVEAMIEHINSLGFFIAIGAGVAMPHARPDDGVIESGISLLKVNSGVCFGNTTVKAVFVIAAKNDDEHVEVLAELAGFLGDPNTLTKLQEAMTVEELQGILS